QYCRDTEAQGIIEQRPLHLSSSVSPCLCGSFFCEMIPATRFQFPHPRAFGNARALRCFLDLSDAGDRDAIDLFWQSRNILRIYGEQEFEILAAMKREHERIERAAAAEISDERI